MNEQKWITHTQAANKAFHANQPGIAVVHYVSALNTAQRQIQLAQVNGAKQAVGMLLMSYHNLAEFWSTRHDSTQQKFYLQQAYDQLLELVKASLIPQEVRRQAYIGLNQAYQSLYGFIRHGSEDLVAGVDLRIRFDQVKHRYGKDLLQAC